MAQLGRQLFGENEQEAGNFLQSRNGFPGFPTDTVVLLSFNFMENFKYIQKQREPLAELQILLTFRESCFLHVPYFWGRGGQCFQSRSKPARHSPVNTCACRFKDNAAPSQLMPTFKCLMLSKQPCVNAKHRLGPPYNHAKHRTYSPP